MPSGRCSRAASCAAARALFSPSVYRTLRTGIVRSRIPFAGSRLGVWRLEIPYGYFERRVQLPDARLEAGTREFTDGCLILRLRKARETGHL